jgi:6-phosphogluconate dehydrogenase
MKAIAAMRNQFGGHATRTEPPAGGDVGPDNPA